MEWIFFIHRAGIHSQGHTEIKAEKIFFNTRQKTVSGENYSKITPLFSSVPQVKILPKHLNLKCTFSVWQAWSFFLPVYHWSSF
jgi:hypothetical protein